MMPVEDVTRLIDAALEPRLRSRDPVSVVRCSALTHLREVLTRRGLNLTADEKRDCCLMPVIFQELNYDDYDWSDRKARLGHLEDMVEIDVIVWTDGLRRSEITDQEYRKYERHTHEAIEHRGKENQQRRSQGN